MQPKERIVFPLDFGSLKEAKPFIKILKDHVGLFKVGLTLFVKDGLKVIETIQEIAGQKVFFDLKFHDIPETVGSVSSVLMAASRGVKFVTVHTSDGDRIVKAAVDHMKGGTKVLGITVLTSLTDQEVKTFVGKNVTVTQRVVALADIAKKAGAAGIVCSGHEAGAVKQQCGQDFIVVTPGIRPAWSHIPQDDQRRIMTPQEAILRGADYIVVGRPIAQAPDPVGAAEKIAHEINEALHQRG